MASGSSQTSFSFVARWIRWAKDQTRYTIMKHQIDFSEGLLRTLYYETDIGSIPRGAEADRTPPKYGNNPNWKRQIVGCYWCLRDRRDVQGICCSNECIYYLHEWCVVRVELFQKRRFCRRPGCDNSPAQPDYSCCSKTHQYEYSELYKWVRREQLNRLVTKGPDWYNSEVSFNSETRIQQNNPFTSMSSVKDSTTMDLATELKTYLIFYTDVGPIPRSYRKAEHSVSQHSNCTNWKSDVRGCYQCGKPVTDRNEYLCSQKCYLVFNEWCRIKVIDTKKIEFCEYPGCGNKPQEGYSTCSREHLDKRNTYLDSNEYYKLVKKGPHWYNNTPSSFNAEMSTSQTITPCSDERTDNMDKCVPKQTTRSSQCMIQRREINTPSERKQPTAPVDVTSDLSRQFVFSAKLTDLLIQRTEVGPIPRNLNHQSRASSSDSTVTSDQIEGCYWCGLNNTSFHKLTCSSRCWHLLHEWSVRKVELVCKVRLCVLPGCEESRVDACTCCGLEHVRELLDLRGDLIGVEEDVDLALGPKWYNDSSPIFFSSRMSPFYEFSNTYCCSVRIKDTTWPTVYHYLCSQKLTSAASSHIPAVESVSELSLLMESNIYQSGVRADWDSVKTKLTYHGILLKFEQNSILKGLLLKTNSRQLICTDGSTPGDILMDVRGKLRTDQYYNN